MRPHERPEIRRLPLFRNMSEDSFDALMRVAYAQTFPPQLTMIEQGRTADFLHIVVEGSVELYASWKQRETTMSVVLPYGTFILAACIKDVPYLMSARTLEHSRIILIPAVDLRSVFRQDPEFAVSTIEELATCYRAMVRHAKNLKLRTARERLAAYLLHQSSVNGDAPGFTLPVEKRLLASHLGMTPENLSRAMKSLIEDGAKADGNRIIITNRERLTALAGPDPLIDSSDILIGESGAEASRSLQG